ncbi:MAG: hypothetical protein AAF570_13170 [Bacteroidota bacterium]
MKWLAPIRSLLQNRFVKVALWTVFGIVVLQNVVFLCFAHANTITTALIYLGLGRGALWILSRFKSRLNNAERYQNIRMLILSSFITLFAAEMTLKYVFRMHLTYSEANGGSFYSSPYAVVDLENFMSNFGFFEPTGWIRQKRPSRTEYTNKPEFNYAHHYNALGFRDKEFVKTKDRNLVRLGVFGDSFAEGVGAPQDSSWAKAMERTMNSMLQPEDTIRFEVYNFGISGSDVFYEYVKLRDVAANYDLDAAILGLNSSDIDDLLVRGGMERFLPNNRVSFRSPPASEYVYCWSFIYRAFSHGVLKRDYYMMTETERAEAEEKAGELITEGANAFVRLADSLGMVPVVVVHPLWHEVKNQRSPLKHLEANFKHAGNNSKLIHMGPYLGNVSEVEGLYWELDQHYNSKGYEWIGKWVGQKMMD